MAKRIVSKLAAMHSVEHSEAQTSSRSVEAVLSLAATVAAEPWRPCHSLVVVASCRDCVASCYSHRTRV